MCHHVNDSVIASARQASNLLKGQVLGQVTILETPYGIVEMKDALRKNVGGEVLCFAY
jgi:ribosomal protein S8